MHTYSSLPTVKPVPLENAPAPGTPAWAKTPTASKVPALMGLSKWDSPYSLWAQATGAIERPAEEEPARKRYDRGHRLEPVLRSYLEEQLRDQGANVRVRHGYDARAHDREDWTAAPDGLVYEGLRRTPFAGVECKTSLYADGWGEEWTSDIPAGYLAQTAWQMIVTGLRRVYVPALVGLEFRVYVVEWADVADVAEEVAAVVTTWQAHVRDGVAPPVDYHPRTLDVVRAMHPDIVKGKTVTVSQSIADMLTIGAEKAAAAEDVLRLAKARALDAAGDAQIIVDEYGVEVARRQARGQGVPFIKLTK